MRNTTAHELVDSKTREILRVLGDHRIALEKPDPESYNPERVEVIDGEPVTTNVPENSETPEGKIIKYDICRRAGLRITIQDNKVSIADDTTGEKLFTDGRLVPRRSYDWAKSLAWIHDNRTSLHWYKKVRDDLLKYRDTLITWRGFEIEIGREGDVSVWWTPKPHLFHSAPARREVFNYALLNFEDGEWYELFKSTVKRMKAYEEETPQSSESHEGAMTADEYGRFLQG